MIEGDVDSAFAEESEEEKLVSTAGKNLFKPEVSTASMNAVGKQ